MLDFLPLYFWTTIRWNKIWEILAVKFLGVTVNNNLKFDERLGNGLSVKHVRLNKWSISPPHPTHPPPISLHVF